MLIKADPVAFTLGSTQRNLPLRRRCFEHLARALIRIKAIGHWVPLGASDASWPSHAVETYSKTGRLRSQHDAANIIPLILQGALMCDVQLHFGNDRAFGTQIN